MEASSEPMVKQVLRRSRNACDACRARKVKCAYDGTVCQSCRELQVPCTQNRPKKRRGPPNQYVQALGLNNLTPSSTASPPSSSVWGLEQLGPFSMIEQIVHDWFNVTHSVCPIFHRGIFMKRLYDRDAVHDRGFCALVVSVCASTVATLRKRGAVSYDPITVERCLEIFDHIAPKELRQKFTLEWCQTRYNFAVALGSVRAMGDMDAFKFLSEAIAGVKYLIFYDLSNMPFLSQQLLKRLYWLLFAATWYTCPASAARTIIKLTEWDSTMDLLGRPCVGLFSPQDNIRSWTPLDLTDSELDSTQANQDYHWHGNTRSYIPGLNCLSQLFLLWHTSQQRNSNTLAHLREHVGLIQRALDYLPPELKWRGGLSRHPQSNFGTDVQTANLYITQLHIRSNLLEQMNNILKTSGAVGAPAEITNERQSIVDDLLEILYHMPEETLQANGHSLLPKIRDIGSALLDEVRTGDHSQAGASTPSASLNRLLAKLDSLDIHPRLKDGEAGLMISP